jgi:hypothetical protein
MKRKKLKGSFVLTAGIVGLLTAGAFAFFIGSFTSEATHTGTVGSGGTGVGTLPMSISFPEGTLSPTVPVELTALVNNTSGKSVTFHKLTLTVVPEVAACKSTWFIPKVVKLSEGGEGVSAWEGFVMTGEEKADIIAAGEHPVLPSNVGIQLTMKNEAISQSQCEGSKIEVKGHLQ